METVRPAQPEDRAACTELLAHAFSEVLTMRGGPTLIGPTIAPELLDTWFAPSNSPVGLFVGQFDGALVGLLAVRTFVRAGSAEPSGQVECCYVDAAARGVGVGSALMDQAVAWCRERDCADIDARALPGDRATKQRLEASGFRARLLTLNRRLS